MTFGWVILDEDGRMACVHYTDDRWEAIASFLVRAGLSSTGRCEAGRKAWGQMRREGWDCVLIEFPFVAPSSFLAAVAPSRN